MSLYANWLLKGRLLASSQPQSLDDLFQARKMGISVVLSFDTHPEERDWCKKLGLRFKEVALEDFEPPNLAKIEEAVSFLHRYLLNQKRSVMMHCYAGLGRTGTVSACFIGALFGLSADEAIRSVRTMRPGSIEVDQEESVKSYLEEFRSGNINHELRSFCSHCGVPILKPMETCLRCSTLKNRFDAVRAIQAFNFDGAVVRTGR
ncbi:MAG: dual specificity protein phosphatase family protein [Thermoprotei archaeon]